MEFHRARLPSKDETVLLQIPAVLPVLAIVRVGRSGKDNQPIAVSEDIIPSDRVETVHVRNATSPRNGRGQMSQGRPR